MALTHAPFLPSFLPSFLAPAPAVPEWKWCRQEGARIILGVNSLWRKCSQGDSGRSKSWQSVCLSVCVTDAKETCGQQEGYSALPTVEICLQLCQVFIIGVVIANGCLASELLCMCVYVYACKCLFVHIYLCMCWPKLPSYLQDRDVVN